MHFFNACYAFNLDFFHHTSVHPRSKMKGFLLGPAVGQMRVDTHVGVPTFPIKFLCWFGELNRQPPNSRLACSNLCTGSPLIVTHLDPETSSFYHSLFVLRYFTTVCPYKYAGSLLKTSAVVNVFNVCWFVHD